MFTFDTADEKQVRRLRIAQFNGRPATVKSGDSTVTGHVRSVREQQASVPPRWTVTIVPCQPKPATAPLRPAFPRLHALMQDSY